LVGAGFALLTAANGEEVYERAHDRDKRYTIKVYSSIQRGASGVRGCGADAIRVVALLNASGRVYPIFKSSRVYRTGSVEAVLDRMIERAREAYSVCNQHQKKRVPGVR
jgi:hypothetical protein